MESWRGWYEFLGQLQTTLSNNPNSKVVFKTYDEASFWAKGMKIKTKQQWRTLKKSNPELFPIGIPANPQHIYYESFAEKEGWVGFLGTQKFQGESYSERCVKHIFGSVFNVSQHRKNYVTLSTGKKISVDMLCSEYRIVLEYDGGYYHADKKEYDLRKTTLLTNSDNQWKVVRARDVRIGILRSEWDVLINEADPIETRIKTIFNHIENLCSSGKIAGGNKLIRRIKSELNKIHRGSFDGLRERQWMPYPDAKKWATESGIASVDQWKTMRKVNPDFFPPSMPANPRNIYKHVGFSWGDFLGTNNIASHKRKYRSLDDASKWAKENGITGKRQWEKLSGKGVLPTDIPFNILKVYGKEAFATIGNWGGFLGTSNKQNEWLQRNQIYKSMEELARWAIENRITRRSQWVKMKRQRPDMFSKDIPGCIDTHYDGGFIKLFETMKRMQNSNF